MNSNKIIEIYRRCFGYLKESKNYLIIVVALFLGTFFIGYFAPVFFVDSIENLLKTLVDETEGMNFSQMFVFIFQNNLKTAFLGIILGLFFGVVPLFYTVVNGYILGFVSSKAASVYGVVVLLRLLPHGIFELPALVISLAVGLKLGTYLFSTKDKKKGFLAYTAVAFSTLIIMSFSLAIFSIALTITNPNAEAGNLMEQPVFVFLIFALAIASFFLANLFVFSILKKKNKNAKSKSEYKEKFISITTSTLEVFLFIILPLLLIAGFIESVLIILSG